MKKLIVITGSMLIIGASFVSASPADKRVAQEAYNTFGPNGGSVSNVVEFPTYTEELKVKVDIEDASGRDVAAQISQDVDRDRRWEIVGTFCGQTEKAVPIIGGRPVRVRFVEEVCSDSGIPAWVTGTVTASFRR